MMSLASRIKAIHHALTDEEPAELLQVSRIKDSPAGEAGQHSVVPSGFLREIPPCCNRQVADTENYLIRINKLKNAGNSDISETGGCAIEVP
jgi:hypothetical protein